MQRSFSGSRGRSRAATRTVRRTAPQPAIGRHLLERLARRRMSDHEQLGTVPVATKIVDASGDASDGFTPALATRIGNVEVALTVELARGHAVPVAVVAFTKPPIQERPFFTAVERDADGLHRPSEIGGEDRVVATIGTVSHPFTGRDVFTLPRRAGR